MRLWASATTHPCAPEGRQPKQCRWTNREHRQHINGVMRISLDNGAFLLLVGGSRRNSCSCPLVPLAASQHTYQLGDVWQKKLQHGLVTAPQLLHGIWSKHAYPKMCRVWHAVGLQCWPVRNAQCCKPGTGRQKSTRVNSCYKLPMAQMQKLLFCQQDYIRAWRYCYVIFKVIENCAHPWKSHAYEYIYTYVFVVMCRTR